MMKRAMVALVIMAAVYAAPLNAGAAGRKIVTIDEIKARAAEAQGGGKKVVVKLRAGAKILVGDKSFPFEFLRDASLSGRIKETRENDFTFADKDSGGREVTSVINYADVLSIERPSGFARTMRKVGKYTLLGAAIPIVLPLYMIAALAGVLPKC